MPQEGQVGLELLDVVSERMLRYKGGSRWVHHEFMDS